jgi:outer membrane lipoprotein-sorting protein
VLKRVLAAEDRVPYSARQTVVLSTQGRAEATVTDDINYGYGRSRVTYLLPETSRNRIIIRDGKTRWELQPSTRTAIRSDIVHRPVPVEGINRIARQVSQSYILKLAKDLSFVAGRPTYILTLSPKQKDRQSRKWWVDAETGLVLKREVYAISGALEQTTSYSNLAIGISVKPAQIRSQIPVGYRTVHRPPDNVVMYVDSARRLDPSFNDLPAVLGSGFEFQSARIVDAQGAKSLLVEYSDGLAGLSIFRIPARTTPPPGASHARTVAVGSTQGTIIESIAPYRVLTWEEAGITFNLVSDIAETTMINLARHVRF